MKKWNSLAVLSVAQFVMVLDQAVMNVSISQLVADFDTTVTVIQSIITLYSLVMAALMVTGGKVGDLIGRRRAFAVGLILYSVGSGLTAVSWSVPILALGWSVLEGIGAALVLPALVALIAGNYADRDRVIAYAAIGGVAGVGIAVGPILGGWLTTYYTWRLVFAGEVVLCAGILVSLRVINEAERPARAPRLDWVGAILSAVGAGVVALDGAGRVRLINDRAADLLDQSAEAVVDRSVEELVRSDGSAAAFWGEVEKQRARAHRGEARGRGGKLVPRARAAARRARRPPASGWCSARRSRPPRRAARSLPSRSSPQAGGWSTPRT